MVRRCAGPGELAVPVSTQVQSRVFKTMSKPNPLETEEDLNLMYSYKLKPTQLDQSCVRIQVLQNYRETGEKTVSTNTAKTTTSFTIVVWLIMYNMFPF